MHSTRFDEANGDTGADTRSAPTRKRQTAKDKTQGTLSSCYHSETRCSKSAGIHTSPIFLRNGKVLDKNTLTFVCYYAITYMLPLHKDLYNRQRNAITGGRLALCVTGRAVASSRDWTSQDAYARSNVQMGLVCLSMESIPRRIHARRQQN